jgi:hypothetical protein
MFFVKVATSRPPCDNSKNLYLKTMHWNPKKWWKGIGLATLALELLCLAISPNPLSIGLIPVGTAIMGGSIPTGLDGIRRALDTSKDGLGRGLGIALALFCLGFAWFGFRLVGVSILASIVLLRWKLGN